MALVCQVDGAFLPNCGSPIWVKRAAFVEYNDPIILIVGYYSAPPRPAIVILQVFFGQTVVSFGQIGLQVRGSQPGGVGGRPLFPGFVPSALTGREDAQVVVGDAFFERAGSGLLRG